MKTIIFILGLSVALMGPAWAQTNPPASPEAVTNSLPPDELMTKLGTVYKKFQVEKADPAGLIISYVPDGGGIGMEKVPFEFLPDDWQKRYGYDPKKAAQFNLAQMRAIAEWREKMIADEKAYRDKRAQLEAEEEAARQAKLAAEAAAALGTNAPAILITNLPTLLATNTPAILATNVPIIPATNVPAIKNPNAPAWIDTKQQPKM
jgi:hypothetical protein